MAAKDEFQLSNFLDPDVGAGFAHLDMLSDTAFNGKDTKLVEMSEVPELNGISPYPGGSEFSAQNILTDLEAIRAEMPFIPVAQWPTTDRSVVLTAGVARDLNIPSGLVLAKFTATGDFYLSSQNRASLPGTTDAADASGGILNPTWSWFYIAGHKQLSVIAPVTGTVVQMVGMSAKLWPTK